MMLENEIYESDMNLKWRFELNSKAQHDENETRRLKGRQRHIVRKENVKKKKLFQRYKLV